MATLEQLWLSAPEGKLCAREQAKAWALRHVWLQAGNGQHGLYSYVAERVQKMKDGKPNGGHPVPNSVKEFLEKVDADPYSLSSAPRTVGRVCWQVTCC